MKPTKVLRAILIAGSLFLCPLAGRAQDYQTTGFQVSLFYPTQLHSDDYSVDGFRWDIFYGVNDDLQGVDIGMVNKSLGNAHGLELGAVNLVDKGFGGFQFSLFNEVKRDFRGVQLGLIANVTGHSFEGVQAAVFFNDAQEEMHGLQIGLINHTGNLQGIQLGLLNFNDETRYLGFFPFINAAF